MPSMKKRAPLRSVKTFMKRSFHGQPLVEKQVKKELLRRRRKKTQVAPSAGQLVVVPSSPQDVIARCVLIFQGILKNNPNPHQAHRAVYDATLSLSNILANEKYSKEVYDTVVQTRAQQVVCELLGIQWLPTQIFLAVGHLLDVLTDVTKTGAIEWTTMFVTDTKAVSNTVPFLLHENTQMRVHACSILANVARVRMDYRDSILGDEVVVNSLVNNLTAPKEAVTVQHALSTISTLCKGTPNRELFLVHKFLLDSLITFLQRVIMEYETADAAPPVDVFREAVGAVLRIVEDRDESQVLGMYHKAIIETLNALMVRQMDNNDLMRDLVTILGNFVFHNVDAAIPDMRDVGVFTKLVLLLQHDSNNVVSTTCWALSNISFDATGKAALLAMDNTLELVDTLVDYSQNQRWNIKKEAMYALMNLMGGATPEQLDTLVVHHECLAVVHDAINQTKDAGLILFGLDAVKFILETNEKCNKEPCYDEQLKEKHVVSVIENLCSHPNQEVNGLAEDILQVYFDGDGDEGVNENAPAFPPGAVPDAAPSSTQPFAEAPPPFAAAFPDPVPSAPAAVPPTVGSASSSPTLTKKRPREAGYTPPRPTARPLFGVRSMNA